MTDPLTKITPAEFCNLRFYFLISYIIIQFTSFVETLYSQTRSTVPVANELMNSFTEK